MNFDSNEAGAQAGSEAANLSQGADNAAGGDQSGIPANYDQGSGAEAGNVDPGAVEADATAIGKPARPPLTPEEYETRHQNINTALRESRAREREFKREMESLRSTVDQFKTSQPEAFERYAIEANLAEYAKIDFNTWAQQDRAAAQAAYNEYQQLVARKGELDQAAEARQQEAQRASQVQQLHTLVNTLNDQETSFRETKPDYDTAVEFLKAELTKDANQQGFFGEEAAQAVNNHMITLGARVNAAGQDMAEFAYNTAVQRGYKAAADIAPMVAGAQAAKTISDVGSAGGAGGASFETTMAELDGAAGRAFWAKAKKNGGRA